MRRTGEEAALRETEQGRAQLAAREQAARAAEQNRRLGFLKAPGEPFASLRKYIKRVIALDKSERMLEQARAIATEAQATPPHEFHLSSADEINTDVVQDESVDLAIAMQAVHWLDMPKLYASLLRVLRPGGSFIFWSYGNAFFPPHGTASEKPNELLRKLHDDTLGKYWEQPQRSFVTNTLDDVPFPSVEQQGWDRSTFTRTKWDQRGTWPDEAELARRPDAENTALYARRALKMRERWSHEHVRRYVETWSALNAFESAHGKVAATELLDSFEAELSLALKVLYSKQKKRKLPTLCWPCAMLSGMKAR